MNDDLPEKDAISQIVKCDFVYSMYPFSGKLRIFSQTSLPTKLTSYVQACRPIFGHGPADSTLADFLQNTATGFMWSSNNIKEGMDILDKIVGYTPPVQTWQNARDLYFGEKNLAVLRHSFQPIPLETVGN